MKVFSHRIVVLVGLGLFAAGCNAESREEKTPAPPPLSPLDGPDGSHGTNGLNPRIYHQRWSELDALLQEPLTSGDTLSRDPRFTSFLATDDGRKLFGYAVGCALGADQNVQAFRGAGLIGTAESWTGAALDQQQRDDVHTCILTRLNPSGEHVPFWVGGPDTGKDTSARDYGYAEAVWSVRTTPSGPVFNVWPSTTFDASTECGSDREAIAEDFNTQLCQNDPSLCTITPRYDLAAACEGQPGAGNWICDGAPAIETRLTLSAWNARHPRCPMSSR